MCPIVFATVIFPNRTKPDRRRGFSSMTRILIVDDNPQVRTALRICLEMHGSWNVCSEAENGQDGVELARQLKPDIVLLDYAMPNMNGLEAARLISASHTGMRTDPIHDVCIRPALYFGASRWYPCRRFEGLWGHARPC